MSKNPTLLIRMPWLDSGIEKGLRSSSFLMHVLIIHQLRMVNLDRPGGEDGFLICIRPACIFKPILPMKEKMKQFIVTAQGCSTRVRAGDAFPAQVGYS